MVAPASRQYNSFFAVSVFLNFVLGYLWIVQRSGDNERPIPIQADTYSLYSPAQSVIRHELVRFTRGVEEDIPIYERPPSPAVDLAWRALYAYSETKIPRSEAMRLPNKTWPILGDESHYMVALDVFHQLHCLDILRQHLHPGHNYTTLPKAHIRHCIGSIRQSLMCAGDVTPIVWQWSEKHQVAEQRDDVLHVCRDYSRIQAWARDHFIDADYVFDFSVFIEDDLEISGF
ncbi:hypothetical protein DFH09DRAFT_1090169 [Mycena vulgaris]|nr:hypothetical protein DFH09DRAFT_1090169 [Mycena vulgaris]